MPEKDKNKNEKQNEEISEFIGKKIETKEDLSKDEKRGKYSVELDYKNIQSKQDVKTKRQFEKKPEVSMITIKKDHAQIQLNKSGWKSVHYKDIDKKEIQNKFINEHIKIK